uniref:T2E6.1 n=1 Tax=Arabidopsis thaliana TaxID=3702 RepID=Q9FZG8_ARATH|nr:T2E6.1 [Arabidopsis thaliana]
MACDAKSGKVIGLDLSDDFLHGKLKSNSSLFRLRHLRDLNLGYNNFSVSNKKDLTSFGLHFQNKIPTKLLQLTKLLSLHLSSLGYFYMPLSIYNSFLHLLARNLRNLRELDMSFSLRWLNLEDCNLFGEFPSSLGFAPGVVFGLDMASYKHEWFMNNFGRNKQQSTRTR